MSISYPTTYTNHNVGNVQNKQTLRTKTSLFNLPKQQKEVLELHILSWNDNQLKQVCPEHVIQKKLKIVGHLTSRMDQPGNHPLLDSNYGHEKLKQDIRFLKIRVVLG